MVNSRVDEEDTCKSSEYCLRNISRNNFARCGRLLGQSLSYISRWTTYKRTGHLTCPAMHGMNLTPCGDRLNYTVKGSRVHRKNTTTRAYDLTLDRSAPQGQVAGIKAFKVIRKPLDSSNPVKCVYRENSVSQDTRQRHSRNGVSAYPLESSFAGYLAEKEKQRA